MASFTTKMVPLVRRSGVFFPSALRYNSPSIRTYGMMPSRGKILREMSKAAREGAKKTDTQTMSEMQKRANNEYFKNSGGPLFPGTFVPLSLSKYPRNPSEFLVYAWYRIKQYSIETLSILSAKLQSMPNWTTRPQWKVKRGRIAPTAKAMYVEMLTAFAAGDKPTVQNLCLGNFAGKLVAAIDRRNSAEKTTFELVKFTKPLFYPRVVAHQIHQVNPYDKETLTEQAVVAISSTQRAAKYSASTGALIPGSTKLQDKIEHVVLSRQVNKNTYESTPWKIWGTTSVTTLEGYKAEQDWINKEQAKRAGWTGESPQK